MLVIVSCAGGQIWILPDSVSRRNITHNRARNAKLAEWFDVPDTYALYHHSSRKSNHLRRSVEGAPGRVLKGVQHSRLIAAETSCKTFEGIRSIVRIIGKALVITLQVVRMPCQYWQIELQASGVARDHICAVADALEHIKEQ